MLTDEFQRRLVDAILKTPGSALRSVRDSYVEMLEQLMGEPSDISRSDDPELDVVAMVRWCANRPYGIGRLVDAVAAFEQRSAAADRLRALKAVREPVSVLQPDERELLNRLLSGLDPAQLRPLVRDIASRWGPRHEPEARDPRRMLGLLEDSIPGAGERHPLAVFLMRLALWLDNEEVVRLAGTVDSRVGGPLPIPGADPAEPAPASGRHYFVVRLAEDGLDPSRYLLTAWLATEEGRWETLCTSETALSLDDVKAEVDARLAILAEAATAEISELVVEFIVPRSLLSADLDQWIIAAPGHTSPFGVHYPVVIRDLPRMRNRLVRGRWKRRCGWVHTHGHTAGGVDVDEGEPNTFGSLLSDPETPACLVVIRSLAYVLDNISAWLSAGLPVIVWCRRDDLDGQFGTHVRRPLESNGIESLPAAVWRLRQDADRPETDAGHVGNHITLLWDCAHRLPPDERPLVSPRASAERSAPP